MKLSDLLEAKKGKDGAILKGGYMLRKDKLNNVDGLELWDIIEMFDDDIIGEAALMEVDAGDEFIFKIVSFKTGAKVSTRVGDNGDLHQDFFDWVEKHINDKTSGIV